MSAYTLCTLHHQRSNLQRQQLLPGRRSRIALSRIHQTDEPFEGRLSQVLHLLAGGDMTIAQVSERFDVTRAAVKKHLSVLSDGGLIHVHPRGRERINSLNPEGFAPVRDYLSFFDQFWDDRLATLKQVIEKENKDD